MLAQGVNNLTTNSKSGNSSKKPNDTPLNDQDQDDTSDHRNRVKIQDSSSFPSQTQTELISAALAAATAAAALASSSTNHSSSPSDNIAYFNQFLNQQNPYLIHQIQQALSNLKQNMDIPSDQTATNSRMDQEDRSNTPIDPNSYVSKIKTSQHRNHHQHHKHHRHQHHHYHNRRHKHTTDINNNINNNVNVSSVSYSLASSSSSSSSPSSSSSSVSSESSPSSPSESPQPQPQTQALKMKFQQSVLSSSMPSTPKYDSALAHGFFVNNQQKNASNSSLHSLTTNNQCSSVSNTNLSTTASISKEVKQKLKNCILQKLSGGNAMNVGAKSTSASLNTNNQQKHQIDSKMQSQTQTQHIVQQKQAAVKQEANFAPQLAQAIHLQHLDDTQLRRTTSEPNLKVKSALKDRLLEKRNLINPFMVNKRPKPSSKQTPGFSTSPLAYHHNNQSVQQASSSYASLNQIQAQLRNQNQSQNQDQTQNTILAAVAAATAAAVAAVSQQQQQQSPAPNMSFIQQLALQHHLANASENNPSQLNLARAILNHYNGNEMGNRLPSSISFPNLINSCSNNSNRKLENSKLGMSSSPKFGHIAHVEEENEILLANELKHAAEEQNDQVSKSVYSYSNEDLVDGGETMRLGRSYSQYQHPHQKYYNYINKSQNRLDSIKKQQDLDEIRHQQAKYSSNKNSYFSDPYLLKSFEIATISSSANINENNMPKKTSQPNENKFLFNTNNNNNNNTKKQINTIAKPDNNKSTQMNAPVDSSLNSVQTQVEEKQYRYTTGLVYDNLMLKHECTCLNQQNHLETPNRIKSIWNRIKSLDLDQDCEVVQTKIATIGDLLNCHNEQYSLIFGSDLEQRPKLPKEYLQMYMMNVCLAPCGGIALTYDQDNSWNEENTPIACRVAIGSTYEVASLVCNGKLKNAFAIVRPPGSHAEYNKPLGFCYFNTVAIVAKMLKKNLSLERILIVDWDVHHGNGTQQMTYNDPNIMYISLHRHENGNFFPGTGSVDECGQDSGLGKNVNIAWNGNLNPAMSDPEYLAAFRCVVMPIAKAFNPQIVLVSCGFDATEQHPKELGGYKVSPTCFAYMTKKLMSLADGKVVLALEGGYDIKSLCDSSELCLNALMNKQIPSFPNKTLDALPNNSAIQDLENVINVQEKYWPVVKDYKKFVEMSHNQYISVYTE